MITMSPLMIKLALYGAAVLLVTGSYFAWAYHIEQVGREKERKEFAEKSHALLQHELAEVKKENDELQERKNNAIKAYADHATNRQSDVDNLTSRLRNSASSCQDTMPREVIDTPIRERPNKPNDYGLAGKIVDLMNSCELWINQIPVEE